MKKGITMAKFARCSQVKAIDYTSSASRRSIMTHLLSWLACALVLSHGYASANDGTFAGEGSNIFPLTETEIRMERENLSFKVRDKVAYVSVRFEFLNPGSEAKDLSVGFVAPGYAGDMPGPANECPVRGFKTMVDGRIIPWNLLVRESSCDTCKLFEPDKFDYDEMPHFGPDFVFLATIRFRPGITVVTHSYQYAASVSVDDLEKYFYRLTTGAGWAKGTIGNIEIDIDMGDNCVFWISDIGPSFEWTVIGSGTIPMDTIFTMYDKTPARLVSIQQGFVRLKAKELHPTDNLSFGIDGILGGRDCCSDPEYQDAFTDIQIWLRSSQRLERQFGHELEIYAQEHLMLMRNMVYALQGYMFTNKDLQAGFQRCKWYIPDPNVTMDTIVLTEREKHMIEQILAAEKALRAGNTE